MSAKKLQIQATTGESSRRGPSASIWADCPVLAIIEDPGKGVHFFDEFLCSYDGADTSVARVGPYETIQESAGSLAGGLVTASGARGVQDLVAGTTADGDVVLTLGGGAPFIISSTASLARKLWFEARFKISTIANDVSSFFIGLAEEDRAAAAGLFQAAQGATVDSALADIDMLGFWRPDADGDGLSVAYGKASATAQELISDAKTLVADTWTKVGFVFDPAAPTTKRIKFFIDGVEQSTYVTAALLAASTFPDGEEMTMVAGITNDDGTNASTLSLDWWRIAQVEY